MTLKSEAALHKDQRTGLADLQHRHFSTIATIIAEMPDAGYRADVALYFADRLRLTNPRFDRARFLRACNVSV